MSNHPAPTKDSSDDDRQLTQSTQNVLQHRPQSTPEPPPKDDSAQKTGLPPPPPPPPLPPPPPPPRDTSSKGKSEISASSSDGLVNIQPAGSSNDDIVESEKLTIESGPANEIPLHPKPSRFTFLSDQRAPTDFKNLQERTMRRRREMQFRMHELDCQVAQMTSKYAEEKMDLDLAIRDTFDRTVCHPLEATVERLTMARESGPHRSSAVAALEKRLLKLDSNMTRHVHVTLSDAKRDEIDSPHDDLLQEIVPSIRIESSKSHKIEGGVVRRFEHVAGVLAQSFHEESAARRADVVAVQQRVQEAVNQEAKSYDDFLAAISDLRAKVSKERAERKAADQRIIDDIVRTTVSVKRALLEAVADSS